MERPARSGLEGEARPGAPQGRQLAWDSSRYWVYTGSSPAQGLVGAGWPPGLAVDGKSWGMAKHARRARPCWPARAHRLMVAGWPAPESLYSRRCTSPARPHAPAMARASSPPWPPAPLCSPPPRAGSAGVGRELLEAMVQWWPGLVVKLLARSTAHRPRARSRRCRDGWAPTGPRDLAVAVRRVNDHQARPPPTAWRCAG